ncbi:MAG: MFS transporter [Anaerolineales bacterium]
MLYSRLVFNRFRTGPARNFWLGVTNGVAFTFAETLIEPTLVLVAFVKSLTDSPLLIGLVSPLRDVGWFLPQLWVSGFAQALPHKLSLYRRAAVVRAVMWGGLALAIFFVRDATGLLVIFFLAFGIYSFTAGFSGSAFMEVIAKTIPPQRRAVFFAWRLFLGGLVALVASALAGWLIRTDAPLAFPHNFAVLFGVGWVFAAFGLWVFAIIDEPLDSMIRPRASLTTQVKRGLAIFRQNTVYRRFVYMRASLILSGAAIPFYRVYVDGQLGGALDMVGVYLAAAIVANLAANVLFGRFAERLGNRRIFSSGALAGLLMSLIVGALLVWAARWPISGATASLWLVPAFACAGIRESALGIAGQPLLLDIVPSADRSLYLGFTNSILGAVLLTTALSGVIVATVGFPVLLIITLVAHAAALFAALQLRQAQTTSPPSPSPDHVSEPE